MICDASQGFTLQALRGANLVFWLLMESGSSTCGRRSTVHCLVPQARTNKSAASKNKSAFGMRVIVHPRATAAVLGELFVVRANVRRGTARELSWNAAGRSRLAWRETMSCFNEAESQVDAQRRLLDLELNKLRVLAPPSSCFVARKPPECG
jgi:hypothetical protein